MRVIVIVKHVEINRVGDGVGTAGGSEVHLDSCASLPLSRCLLCCCEGGLWDIRPFHQKHAAACLFRGLPVCPRRKGPSETWQHGGGKRWLMRPPGGDHTLADFALCSAGPLGELPVSSVVSMTTIVSWPPHLYSFIPSFCRSHAGNLHFNVLHSG